jgi:hypothetical protein
MKSESERVEFDLWFDKGSEVWALIEALHVVNNHGLTNIANVKSNGNRVALTLDAGEFDFPPIWN